MSYKQRSRSNSFLNLLLVVMILLAAAVVWFLVPRFAEDQFGPASSALTTMQKWEYSLKLISAKNELLNKGCLVGAPISFTVEMGESINSISLHMQSAGIIKKADSFRNYLIYKGLDTQILAKDYSLNCANTPVEVAAQIQNNTLEKVLFVILPGWRAEEIADALKTSGINVSPEQFLSVVKNPAGLQLPSYIPAGSSLEGFMFPGEYTIDRNVTAEGLVQIFIDRFAAEMTDEGINLTPQNGLDFYQTIILASIIQRETYADEERPMIASVFYNRLTAGMRLETDPTVQYALGYDAQWGWWKSPLSSDDLKISSPYNTYQISGLPPAPIANPDLSSIKAAINPESSNYYYFRSNCDGSGTHVFATTLDEQIANACQ